MAKGEAKKYSKKRPAQKATNTTEYFARFEADIYRTPNLFL